MPEEPQKHASAPSRRTLIKAAAWSVPTVAIAVSAPNASASPPAQVCQWTGKNRVTASDDNTNSRSQAERTLEIPAGTKEIRFTVAGARGAGGGAGNGAVIQGTIPIELVASGPLRLIAGSSGVNRHGGVGWGNGGNGTTAWGGDGSSTKSGLGGGAASAILFGSTQLVVAGGGGGGALSWRQKPSDTSVTYTNDRGHGGENGARGVILIRHDTGVNDPTSIADGGAGATTDGPGAGGEASGGGYGNSGNPGVNRDGGDAGGPADRMSSSDTGAGGGGGGYFGGGGGSTRFYRNDAGSTQLAGGGGGGSSYVASNVNGQYSNTRNTSHGYVEIEFYVCS